MRRFAPLAVAVVLLAAAAAGWFAYTNSAAVRSDFGGTPTLERL